MNRVLAAVDPVEAVIRGVQVSNRTKAGEAKPHLPVEPEISAVEGSSRLDLEFPAPDGRRRRNGNALQQKVDGHRRWVSPLFDPRPRNLDGRALAVDNRVP